MGRKDTSSHLMTFFALHITQLESETVTLLPNILHNEGVLGSGGIASLILWPRL
jgi:hypothetical protein